MHLAQGWVDRMLHCRNGGRTRYLCCHMMTERETEMTTLRNAWNRLLSAMDTLGASLEAARAVRAHRRPADASLKQLGIRRDSFPTHI